MALARRSTRAAVSKNQQEPVAQRRRATKLAAVTKDAEEARATMEAKQRALEPLISDMGASQSRKRKRVVPQKPDELPASLEPRRKSPKTRPARWGIQLAELASIQVQKFWQ